MLRIGDPRGAPPRVPRGPEADRRRAALLGEAEAALDGHHDVRYAGMLKDAKKEFAEANLTLAFVADDPLPTAESLGVEPPPTSTAWPRRRASCAARCSTACAGTSSSEAERLLGAMDEVYGLLVTIDYPEALTGGLRRTTDALRGVLERTRGDVTTAIVARPAAGRDRRVRSGPHPGSLDARGCSSAR